MMIWKNSFFILFAKKRVDTLPTRVIISDESPEDIWNNVGFFLRPTRKYTVSGKIFPSEINRSGSENGHKGIGKKLSFFFLF